MKRHWLIVFLVAAIIFGCAFVGGFAEKSLRPIPTHPVEMMLLQTQEATVRISISTENGFRHIGSGFVATADGYIITARHIAAKPVQHLVVFANGTVLEAKVAYVSTFTDCAVLKVDHRGLACATLRSVNPFLGEQVFTIGSPIDELFENYVTSGIVSKLRVNIPSLSLLDLFMLDAPINPGNSGGPVVDERGQVVGMTVAIVPNTEGLGYAVYVSDIADTLEKARGKAKDDKN